MKSWKGQTIRKDKTQSYGSKVIITMIAMIAKLPAFILSKFSKEKITS